MTSKKLELLLGNSNKKISNVQECDPPLGIELLFNLLTLLSVRQQNKLYV